jgi:hypothetical protein
VFQTQSQGAATISLTIRYDPTHSVQAQRQTLFNGAWCFHTITAVAIPQANAQGYPSIPAYAETQQDLFEIGTPIFTMPIGRSGRPVSLRFVLIDAIERNGRRVLMQPGRRERIDLQGFESDGAKHGVEIGRKQRIEDVPQAVIIEGSTR